MFDGVNACVPTPLEAGTAKPRASLGELDTLCGRAAAAGADSVVVLGATGNRAYLDREEKFRVMECARDALRGMGTATGLIVGIGAMTSDEVLACAAHAERCGADALLLEPVGYHRLTEDEAFGLYSAVSQRVSTPVIVDENPSGFAFSPVFLRKLSALPRIDAVSLAGTSHVKALSKHTDLALGIGSDAVAIEGIDAGCTSWYSAIGGVLPGFSVALARARREGDDARVAELTALAEPLWELMRRYGEARVTAAIATDLGLTQRDALAKPLLPLAMRPRARALEAARAMLGAS